MTNGTARIDINRLQLLHDRICQTLEALNLVRLSAYAHAPSYAQSPVWWNQPAMNTAWPAAANFGWSTNVNPLFDARFMGGWNGPVANHFAPGFAPNFVPNFAPGFGLSPVANPWNQTSAFLGPISYGSTVAPNGQIPTTDWRMSSMNYSSPATF